VDVILILIIICCVFIEAISSGTEIGIISANSLKLNILSRKGVKGTQLIKNYLKNPAKLLSTTLSITDLSVVTSTSIATYLMTKYLGEGQGLYSILIISPIILLCGELIPKSLFRKFPVSLSVKSVYFLHIAGKILSPLIFCVSVIANTLLKLIPARFFKRHKVSRRDFKTLLNSKYIKDEISLEEHKFLKHIFEFGEEYTREIMVPLVKVKLAKETSTIEEMIELVKETGFTRFPVYRERIDNIVGIVNIYDLIHAVDEKEKIKKFVQPAQFFSEYMRVDDLFYKMKKDGIFMSVIVDEYGGIIGMATVEDCVEEIMGEIEDEYDKSNLYFHIQGKDKYIIDADAEIDRINEDLKLNIKKEEDYETIGGFVIKRLGYIPRKGEILSADRCNFTVLDTDGRKIKKILLKKIQ